MKETDPPAARTAVMSSRQHQQPAERAVVPKFPRVFEPASSNFSHKISLRCFQIYRNTVLTS